MERAVKEVEGGVLDAQYVKLVDENAQLKEVMDKMKLQVDLYKSQSINLTKQVQNYEEKIKFYYYENTRHQSTLEEQMSLFTAKEVQLNNEIEQKNVVIGCLKKKLDADNKKLNDLLMKADNFDNEKQRLSEQLKELEQKLKNTEIELKSKKELFNKECTHLMQKVNLIFTL